MPAICRHCSPGMLLRADMHYTDWVSYPAPSDRLRNSLSREETSQGIGYQGLKQLLLLAVTVRSLASSTMYVQAPSGMCGAAVVAGSVETR